MIANIAVLFKMLGAGICLTYYLEFHFPFHLFALLQLFTSPNWTAKMSHRPTLLGGEMGQFYDWKESVGGFDDMTRKRGSKIIYVNAIFFNYIYNTHVSCLFSMVKTLPNTMVLYLYYGYCVLLVLFCISRKHGWKHTHCSALVFKLQTWCTSYRVIMPHFQNHGHFMHSITRPHSTFKTMDNVYVVWSQ